MRCNCEPEPTCCRCSCCRLRARATARYVTRRYWFAAAALLLPQCRFRVAALITETPSPTASASLAAAASRTAREDQSVAACCTIAAAVSVAGAYYVPPRSALARGRGRGCVCRRAVCHASRSPYPRCSACRAAWAVFLLARVTGNVAIAVAELVISTATRVTRTLSRRRRIFFVVVATSVGETRFSCLPLLLRELVAAAKDATMDATVFSALIMTPSRSPCCRLFQRVESTALAVRVVLTLAVACGPTASAPACPPSRRLAQAPSPCTRRCVWSSPCPVALTT
jgi:hypothetical protein